VNSQNSLVRNTARSVSPASVRRRDEPVGRSEEAHGWRVVLFGYGALVFVGVTLLSMLVRDRPEPYGLRADGDPPEEGASTERPTGPSRRRTDAGLTLRAVLRTK